MRRQTPALHVVAGTGAGSSVTPPSRGNGAGATQKRPRCPRDFAPDQRSQWFNILNRLEERDLLSCTPEGNIRALAVYQADFQRLNEFLTLHGDTRTVPRRPYMCPACKGTAIQASGKRKAAPTEPQPDRSTLDGRRERCSICRKRNREQIDAALLKGTPLRQLVEQTGTSVGALHRHKMQCLKVKPAAPADRPCKGCKGTGVVQGGEVTYQYPEVARRDVAAAMVAKLSASLGLDNVSLAKLQGGINKPQAPGGLREMMKHRAKLRQ